MEKIQKRVLLVVEQNAGIGHFIRLRRYGLRLKSEGWFIIAGFNSWAKSHHLSDIADETVAVPSWPGHQGEAWHFNPEDHMETAPSFAAHLVQLGCTLPCAFANIFKGWEHILTSTKPDAIICDNAPAAALSCAGRLPVVVVGTGHTVPCLHNEYFVPIDGGQPDLVFQDKVREQIAELARKCNLHCAPLAIFPAFAGDLALPSTLSALDPYTSGRKGPIYPPEIDVFPKKCKRKKTDLFVYLGDGAPSLWPVMEKLNQLDVPIRMFTESSAAIILERISQPNIEVTTERFTIDTVRENAFAYLHHGGMGTTQLAALTGTPQIIAYNDEERWRNAIVMYNMGVGVASKPEDITSRMLQSVTANMRQTSSFDVPAEIWRTQALKELSRVEPVEAAVEFLRST
jgi:hypothetical protein